MTALCRPWFRKEPNRHRARKRIAIELDFYSTCHAKKSCLESDRSASSEWKLWMFRPVTAQSVHLPTFTTLSPFPSDRFALSSDLCRSITRIIGT